MIFRLDLLPLALLVPALMALACALYVRRRRRAAAALGSRPLVSRIAGLDLHAVPWRRISLLVLAALALGLAAADPRWGTAQDTAQVTGRHVVLVLDASNSMLVEDVAPNRLAQQRAAAHRLLRALANDRVGVIVFAGQASVLTPPTLDHAAVEMFIDAVRPEIAVQTGTAIGAGVRQATSLLAVAPEGRERRIVVLLSDGEPLEPEEQRQAARAAGQQAARLGVTVHTVGIGTARGGPVPDIDPRTGRQEGFKRDPFTGQIAISALDAELLREIARATRGSYHALTDPRALDALLARLGTGASPAAATPVGADAAPRYAWFVAVALLLLLADAGLERRARRGSSARAGIRDSDVAATHRSGDLQPSPGTGSL
jgi:Ca-activated chloride channel homolog